MKHRIPFLMSIVFIASLVGVGLVPAFAKAPLEWNQVNEGGFGDPVNEGVLSLDSFKGDLYAGVANFLGAGASVWRWDGDSEWTRVTEYGFGSDPYYSAVTDLATFDGQLYAAVTDWMGFGLAGQIWRTPDGVNWEAVVDDGFDNPDNYGVMSFTVYEDMLYAGTGNNNGTEIWRSAAGDPGSWEMVADGGFGTATNNQVTAFIEFKDALYVATETNFSPPGTAQVWRSDSGDLGSWEQVVADGFGNPNNSSAGGFAAFRGYLYLGSFGLFQGGPIWRSHSGDPGSWEQVNESGFGDTTNIKVESLYQFRGQLYAVTFNFDIFNSKSDGMEVWRSADGLEWELVQDNGFEDDCNYSTLWSDATLAYKGGLLIGTWNFDIENGDFCDGGEIWQLAP